MRVVQVQLQIELLFFRPTDLLVLNFDYWTAGQRHDWILKKHCREAESYRSKEELGDFIICSL